MSDSKSGIQLRKLYPQRWMPNLKMENLRPSACEPSQAMSQDRSMKI